MKFEVNIEKKWAFAILFGFLLVAGVIGVYALTAGTAPNPGHTLNDVSAPSGCGANTILQWTGSAWSCVSVQPEVQYCNKIDTGSVVSDIGYYPLDLLKNGVNMCADDNGCTYRVWAYDNNKPAGSNFYQSYPVNFRQVPGGKWHDAVGDNTGTNGDSVSTALFADFAGGYFYDDTPSGATPAESDAINQLIFRDNSAIKAFFISICDF